MEGKARGGSFMRRGVASAGDVLAEGARAGPHGTSLVSSGLSDLDEIIGGGIPVGTIVMVMEDLEAPHHMLLMRYFMAQGLVHGQPLLFASPLPSPKSFLGTLPGLASGEEQRSSRMSPETKGEDLRIAWQYRRFLNEQQELADRRLRQQDMRASSMSSEKHLSSSGHRQEYSTQFDLRKPLDRAMWTSANIECLSLQGGAKFASLQEKCATFFGSLSRFEGRGQQVGRIALQSLCAPQCITSLSDWQVLAFLHGLKSRLREARAVGFITFPSALLKPSVCARWQHVSDILLSVEAVQGNARGLCASFVICLSVTSNKRIEQVLGIVEGLGSFRPHVSRLYGSEGGVCSVPLGSLPYGFLNCGFRWFGFHAWLASGVARFRHLVLSQVSPVMYIVWLMCDVLIRRAPGPLSPLPKVEILLSVNFC